MRPTAHLVWLLTIGLLPRCCGRCHVTPEAVTALDGSAPGKDMLNSREISMAAPVATKWGAPKQVPVRMSEFASTYLRTLSERGFIHQITDPEALDAALAGDQPVAAYIGFDCTAPSLHVGSLVQIMLLRHLQQAGHRPVVLMGGGTTKVGDPSGRDESRKLLSDADITANMDSIRTVFERFLSFGDGPADAVMVNNDDWLRGLGYVDFLRDVGQHFTINRMLTFDSVKLRLERQQPLSFLEFNYMILQAYDFLELHRRCGCRLQMGGSDQWGNIVNGMELARRMERADLYGLTSPLITTADGGKMGKTAKGAVWLNPGQLSDHDYWQFWRNTQDADVGRFLKLFTDLPLDEIARLEAMEGSKINEAKKILANEATRLCRGEAASERVAVSAKSTYEEGGIGDELPTVEISEGQLLTGVANTEILVSTGLCSSKKEARRKIKEGAARLNNIRIETPDELITNLDIAKDGVIKISIGKKRHALVKPTK